MDLDILIQNKGDAEAKLYLEKIMAQTVSVPSQWWLILHVVDGEFASFDISQAKPEEV